MAFPRILALILFATAQAVHAQGALGNGIVNAAGQFGGTIGTVGAGANRQAANQLFQQGLSDEASGFATMNVGLLSKALTEGLSGVQADDQSRHFGQAAMQALQSGSAAGNVDLNEYGTSQDQIKELANNSSPLMPQAQAEFSKFGIQVDHSQELLKTTFGDFPLNTSIDSQAGDLTKIISSVAESKGYSSADVADGVKAGLSARDDIMQKAMADAQRAAGGAGAGAATQTAANPTPAVAPKAVAAKPAPVGIAVQPATASSRDFDMQQRMLALNKSREETKQRLGADYKIQSLVAFPSQDLYTIVHNRYQELTRAGQFDKNISVAAIPSR